MDMAANRRRDCSAAAHCRRSGPRDRRCRGAHQQAGARLSSGGSPFVASVCGADSSACASSCMVLRMLCPHPLALPALSYRRAQPTRPRGVQAKWHVWQGRWGGGGVRHLERRQCLVTAQRTVCRRLAGAFRALIRKFAQRVQLVLRRNAQRQDSCNRRNAPHDERVSWRRHGVCRRTTQQTVSASPWRTAGTSVGGHAWDSRCWSAVQRHLLLGCSAALQNNHSPSCPARGQRYRAASASSSGGCATVATYRIHAAVYATCVTRCSVARSLPAATLGFGWSVWAQVLPWGEEMAEGPYSRSSSHTLFVTSSSKAATVVRRSSVASAVGGAAQKCWRSKLPVTLATASTSVSAPGFPPQPCVRVSDPNGREGRAGGLKDTRRLRGGHARREAQGCRHLRGWDHAVPAPPPSAKQLLGWLGSRRDHAA
jgi:hypothetical protein